MSTYDSSLPLVFPYVAIVTEHEAITLSRILTSKDDRHDHGSSFAITSDAYIYPRGRHMRRLWLSAASAVRVRRVDSSIPVRQSYEEGE